MSAEERLAALDALDQIETDLIEMGMEQTAAAMNHPLAVLRAGVSVPTEPGAPDLAEMVRSVPLGDEPLRFDVNWNKGFAAAVEALRGILASRPVPAPKPSARLREALTAWERNGAPNRKSLAAFGLRAALAATPQDPEA